MINPLAIAVQGIGFSPGYVALQGFWFESEHKVEFESVGRGTVFMPYRYKGDVGISEEDEMMLIFAASMISNTDPTAH